MKKAILFINLALLIPSIKAQTPEPPQSLKELVRTVTGDKGDNEGKTRKLVKWINTNFKWSYTDYQKRTVEEIIQRRAGNCAELANVLAALLNEGSIRFRWVSEINIQQQSERRQGDAAKLIAEKGNRYSVFGFMHNDHVWLEVFDEKGETWFPADPAVGVVGLKEWIAARMAFTQRVKPMVPEVAKIVKEMLVPVAVLAKETRAGKPVEVRSGYYLIEGFNAFYGGRLAKLPAWKAWNDKVANFADLGNSAFAGEINLHEHQPEIEQLWQTYEKLRQEAGGKNY